MKKAVIILSMLLTVLGVTAQGAELTVGGTGMDYEADAYFIELHHSADEERTVTVQMENAQGEGNVYFSQHMTDGEGNITLKIPMDSQRNPSGEYQIKLSGADIAQPVCLSVTYVNKMDAQKIISAIRNNEPGLADYIREHIYSVGLGPDVKKMWDEMGSEGQDAVVKAIGGKKFEIISEVEEAFAYGICTFRINQAGMDEMEQILSECAPALGLEVSEGSYFSEIANKQPVYAALQGKNFSLDQKDEVEKSVRSEFKTAVAITWVNESELSDRDRVLTVLEDANEYLGLPLDEGFAGLSPAQQTQVIIAMLDDKPFSGKEALKRAFQKALEGDEKRPGGSGSGSSGGGGSSGGNSSPSGGASHGGTPSVPSVALTPSPEPDTGNGFQQEGFRDIQTHWAKDYINELAEADIIAGTGDGCFSPDRNILREEFVKIIVRAMELQPQDSASVYEDVRADQWYYPYIVAAEKAGLVKGIDETHFGIGDQISRQDAAVLIARMLEMKGIVLDGGSAAGFADQDEIPGYAAGAVNALKDKGIVSGDDTNRFHPQGNTTRAEAAKMVFMALKQMSDEE